MSEQLPRAKRVMVSGAKPYSSWACYKCGTLLVRTDFQGLQERETWKCRNKNCGSLQILGKAVLLESLGRVTVDAGSAEKALPQTMDTLKLAKIQSEYDEMKKRSPKRTPSQTKIAQLVGIARSTVREYWPFVRK